MFGHTIIIKEFPSVRSKFILTRLITLLEGNKIIKSLGSNIFLKPFHRAKEKFPSLKTNIYGMAFTSAYFPPLDQPKIQLLSLLRDLTKYVSRMSQQLMCFQTY